MTTSVIDQYRRAFDAVAPNGVEAEVARQRRLDAFEAFAALGFPTRRVEDWKYVPDKPLAGQIFLPTRGDDSAARAMAEDTAVADEILRVVFVDGVFSPDLSRLDPLPEGVSVTRLADADADEVIEISGETSYADGVDALTDAFALEGVLVRFSSGTETDGAAHLIHVTTGSDQATLAATRSYVVAEPNAYGHVVESYVGAGSALRLTRTVVRVGNGAKIRHERIQVESTEAIHIGRQRVDVGRDARYDGFNFSLGAALSRDALDVRLLEPGGHTSIAALYVPRGRQTIDNHTAIEHMAPSCTSDQLYKGILDGSGHGVFNGRIIVHPDAQQTAAEQLNQNLMLTREARIDTKPQLEIFADDVRCTHGATIGQISPTELFYMMSRAIPEATARTMLIFAFADDALRRIAATSVRDQLTRRFRDVVTT